MALFALRLIVSALNCWVFCLLVFDDICLFWVFCLLVFNDICPFCVGVSDIPSASMAFDGSPPTDFVPPFPSASMTFDGSPPTDLVPVPLYSMAFDGTFQLPFPPGMIPLFPPSAMPPIPTWWIMPPIIPPLPPLLTTAPPLVPPWQPVPFHLPMQRNSQWQPYFFPTRWDREQADLQFARASEEECAAISQLDGDGGAAVDNQSPCDFEAGAAVDNQYRASEADRPPPLEYRNFEAGAASQSETDGGAYGGVADSDRGVFLQRDAVGTHGGWPFLGGQGEVAMEQPAAAGTRSSSPLSVVYGDCNMSPRHRPPRRWPRAGQVRRWREGQGTRQRVLALLSFV